MDSPGKWEDFVNQEIDTAQEKFHKAEVAKLRLNDLRKLAFRTDKHTSDCEECQNLKITLKDLLGKLEDLKDASSKMKRQHRQTIAGIMEHFQSHHHVYAKGQLMFIAISISMTGGISLGLLYGTFMGHIWFSNSIGLFIGLIIGLII